MAEACRAGRVNRISNTSAACRVQHAAPQPVKKASVGGVGGPAGPLTVIVSRGFAARAGRFRHLPKPFLTFFTAISLG